jgi:predicted DNA-binding transcriptional regulator AlpA
VAHLNSHLAGALTRAELLELPASVPLWPTAGRAFGLGRSKTYELAQSGEFPVEVFRLGKAYRVASADILALLRVTAG